MKQVNSKNSPPPPEKENSSSAEGKRRRTARRRTKIGEVAGGTAAGCAAICCCCPCGVMNFLVLALYKLPAGLCREMWRRRKLRRKKKKDALLKQSSSSVDIDGPLSSGGYDEGDVKMIEGSSINAVELDNEMLTHFYGAGFWRSSSQRQVKI